MPGIREHPGPYLNVPVLDLGQAAIDVALGGVGFGGGEDAVKEGRVGLVLPVMAERVWVDWETPGKGA